MTGNREGTVSHEAQIVLEGVTKLYGPVTGVREADLVVHKGEFFSLLGPSGCGKSTILKLIAGFETPTAGEIRVAGRSMAGVSPEQRNIGLVFQNYALFPHLDVFENVAFGLRARRVPEQEIRRRVETTLDLVELPSLARRRPGQLSGGQQQRVALARALVIEPDVLLLDEPLAALDKKLRQAMQLKLVELQRKLGVTTVFVTHDQEEALTMSDRVGVMSARRHAIEQIGRPQEIYRQPVSVVVSDFIGQTNLWEEAVVEANGESCSTARGFTVPRRPWMRAGTTIVVSVRPERIAIGHAGDAGPDRPANRIEGRVREVVFVGETLLYLVDAPWGQTLQVKALNSEETTAHRRGEAVVLSWRPDAMLPLPREDGARGEDGSATTVERGERA